MMVLVRTVLASVVCVALVGCGGDDHDDLGGAGDLLGADLPITLPDLSICSAGQFNGFPGSSPIERRLDCSGCGCLIDTLTMAADQALWTKSSVSATFSDSAPGINIVADGSTGPAFATLASLNPGGPFFLDGDFDLRVDYLVSLLVPGTHVALRVDSPDGTFFEVARSRSPAGENDYTASLAGVASAHANNAIEGTLRLVRSGTALVAYGDNNQLQTSTAVGTGRAAIYLAAGIDGCFDADAGSCELVATLHDVRLASGALVDRR
jgi:hypothetical protein